MKKIFLILGLIFVLASTACGAEERADRSEKTGNSEETVVDKEENSAGDEFDEEELCRAYETGTWDGSFIYNDKHCASVEQGILWIDNDSTSHPIDMGTMEKSLLRDIVGKSAQGTYIAEDGRLQLWYRGEMILDYEHPLPYYGTVSYQISENAFIFRYGKQMIWWADGESKTISDEIIDSEQYDDKVRYTTFAHEVYEVNVEGESVKVGENTVRFQENNLVFLKFSSSEDRELFRSLFKAWETNKWDGGNSSVSEILQTDKDGRFAQIDDYGNMYMNNKLVANYRYTFRCK